MVRILQGTVLRLLQGAVPSLLRGTVPCRGQVLSGWPWVCHRAQQVAAISVEHCTQRLSIHLHFKPSSSCCSCDRAEDGG